MFAKSRDHWVECYLVLSEKVWLNKDCLGNNYTALFEYPYCSIVFAFPGCYILHKVNNPIKST